MATANAKEERLSPFPSDLQGDGIPEMACCDDAKGRVKVCQPPTGAG